MICPFCEMEQAVCVDSRQREKIRWRRYKCLSCGKRFHTEESVVQKKRRKERVERGENDNDCRTI